MSYTPCSLFRSAGAFVLLLVLFTGCTDSFTGSEPGLREEAPPPTKLRNAALMERAMKKTGTGKITSSSSLNLILSINKQSTLERYGVLERYTTLERYGVLERYEYNNVFGGFAITVEDSLGLSDYNAFLDLLEADPDILWYEPDYTVDTPLPNSATGDTTQQVPWSVAAIGGQESWTVSGDGTGEVNLHVFILDTGVAQAATDDPNDDLRIVESLDFRTMVNDPKDYDGHGTHIAGIVGAIDDADGLVGVAPAAKIHNYKVLDDNGTTDASVVIAALEHILALRQAHPNEPMVVNLSLGENTGTAEYTALDESVEALVNAGVVVVVAAGNQGVDASLVTPAKVTGAITVGSHDVNGVFSLFSNHGPLVDLLAPGEAILSLAPAGNGTVATMSGTSMSAAHVTGAAALYLARHPAATPQQVRDALVSHAKAFVVAEPTGTTNRSVWVGPAGGS